VKSAEMLMLAAERLVDIAQCQPEVKTNERLLLYRRRRKLTAKQVYDATGIGANRLSALESGKSEVTAPEVRLLAEAYWRAETDLLDVDDRERLYLEVEDE